MLLARFLAEAMQGQGERGTGKDRSEKGQPRTEITSNKMNDEQDVDFACRQIVSCRERTNKITRKRTISPFPNLILK